jgi:tRNA modification GTPase
MHLTDGKSSIGRRAGRDTIFALSTTAGAAGIAVIRISGPQAAEALRLVQNENRIKERSAEFRRLYELSTGVQIDDAIVLWFPAPRSYTAEDTVEFQTHGGRAVTGALLSALAQLPGFRPAEPGEFTRRAVENGRMDLTRAEAVADLIAAETEAQRRLALRQYDGELACLYTAWRERLIRAAAWIEAGIDFADEDVPEGVVEQSQAELRRLQNEVQTHLTDGRRGEIIRDGFHIAVIGPPNAGKSSLVNALARRDVAIVSEHPGTTRDVIEVKLDLSGYAVVLADTAGLRDSAEPVEREGIRRARARAEAADFRLLILDAQISDSTARDYAADLVVLNKADLVQQRNRQGLYISAKTGEGLAELTRLLGERAVQGGSTEAPLLTRARHRYAVEEVADCIGAALREEAPELAAEQLRLALRSLGRITGVVDLDELLDVVFRDFCIGK